MSAYAKLIAEITGTGDPATLALIEQLMRASRPGLDSLSPARFRAAVREAAGDAAELAREGMLAYYCDALGLAVPVPAS